jgi:hypothetical protein
MAAKTLAMPGIVGRAFLNPLEAFFDCGFDRLRQTIGPRTSHERQTGQQRGNGTHGIPHLPMTLETSTKRGQDPWFWDPAPVWRLLLSR